MQRYRSNISNLECVKTITCHHLQLVAWYIYKRLPPSCGTLTTTFPQVPRPDNATSASLTLSNPTNSSSVNSVPRSLPSLTSFVMPCHTTGMVSLSLMLYAPQWMPTREMFLRRTLFMATFSMAPPAKPTIRIRPFHAVHLVDLSTSPTGS